MYSPKTARAKLLDQLKVLLRKLMCAHNFLEDFIEELENTKDYTIVLIDECETFLAERNNVEARRGGGYGHQKNENDGSALIKWLNFTSKSHKYVQFIFTTPF